MISFIALILGFLAHFFLVERMRKFTLEDFQNHKMVDLYIVLAALTDLGICGLFGSEFLIWALKL